MQNISYGLGDSLTSRRRKIYNSFLVLVDIYSKTPMFLPFHKDDTAMDTAIMIWNKAISHTGLFQHSISDRDPKFTSALWTNLHSFLETKLSFSTAVRCDYEADDNITINQQYYVCSYEI
ncbi:hypothetical protein O181_087249 [Austropuccinia psidii MF-1]|uniref:Integrase catalytic domain-containing protein n=1 Tax=Austropuccinia psidii MF-1 TaxID=1389203 RepID=A0A9Q3P198_9BASI|nr:hypothetical protein [Austropuccinia psidii MF-1]